MSVSIYVAAQRTLTQGYLDEVRVYNELVDMNHIPPDAMVKNLKSLLGDDACDEWGHEEITVDVEAGNLVECSVQRKGAAMYGNGKVIQIADLPPDTVALWIYAMA